MIRLIRRGNLRKWKRFKPLLFQRGIPHNRRPMACLAAPKGKGPHWHRRKMRRRYLRRRKRIDAMWARYKKVPRLTERQFKKKQRKQFIEELYRQVKIMFPYFRMRQKVFACGAINVFEILRRKLAVKKWVLEKHIADQSILLYQLSFLKSTSTIAMTRRNVQFINKLTRMKIKGALAFKNVLLQRKIINRRLAEKRKYFLNVLVPLAEYYHKIKKYDNVSVPRYFTTVEKVVYQEREVQVKKTTEQRFLQVFGVAQMQYMELKAAAKEMGFYLQTRYYFITGATKIINQLYYAKDVVLELLRDGHEVLTKMFHYYFSYANMEAIQTKIQKILEKRRVKSSRRRRLLEYEVEFLLSKHKSHKQFRQCPADVYAENTWIETITGEDKPGMAKHLYFTHKGERYVIHRRYIDGMDGRTMKQAWAKFSGDLEDLLEFAIKLDIKNRCVVLHTEDENNRALYYEEREKVYVNCILFVFYSSILYSVRACILYINRKRIKPFAYDVEAHSIVNLLIVMDDAYVYEKMVRNMFKLTKRTSKYRLGMLGIHHKMIGGNRDKCLKLEFKFFRMFLAIKNSITSKIERRLWSKARKQREEKKNRVRLINYAVLTKVNKEILRTFNFYTTNFDTLCPLCCSADRENVLEKAGQAEDVVQDVKDIVASAQHYYLGVRDLELTHDIEHCSQPAATFLLKIKILEERRKNLIPGRDPWINF